MASSSGDGLNGPILHPVWSKLPLELVEVVLKCVPFESLVRFRAVCKRFNSLITSPKFARECQRQQVWKPVPVIVGQPTQLDSCSIEIFNSETNSWLTHPLPILEANLKLLELDAASGGLLCFRTGDYGKFVVYNPLTGAFRLVVSPFPLDYDGISNTTLCFKRDFSGLVVDRQTGTFTLVHVTVTRSGANRLTFLYDSADGSWRSGAPFPDMECVFDIRILTSNESIYGLVDISITEKFCYTLLKYDVRRDSWSEMSLPSFVDEDLEIIEHRRQVVLWPRATKFGRLLSNNDFGVTCYRVREATTGHGETLVEERVVFQGLHGNVESLFNGRNDNSGRPVTTGIGDVIMSRCSDPRYPMQMLHFNCTTQKLTLLPDCLTKSNLHSPYELELTLLEPSLTVDLQ